MPNESTAQAGAAPVQEHATVAADEQARIDAYTDAVTTFQPPAVIARLEAEMRGTPQEQPAATKEEPKPEGAEATPDPVAETETPAEPAETPDETKTETPEPGETPTEEVQVEGKLADRVRLNHLSDPEKAEANAIVALTRGGMSLKEATQRVLGNFGGNTEPEPQAPETPPHIVTLESKLADVRAKLKEEKKEGALGTPEIDALEDERSVLIAQLAVARNAIETAGVIKGELTEAEFQRTRQTVLNAAVNAYPSMKDKTSTQWLVAKGIGEQMRDPDHPDHARLFESNAPMFIATKAAEKLGIKPAGTPPAPVTQQTPAPKAAKPGPARGSSQSAPPQPQKTVEQRIAESEVNLLAALEGRPVKAPSRTAGGALFLG